MSFKDSNSGRLIIFRLFSLVIMLTAIFCAVLIFDISADNSPAPPSNGNGDVSLFEPTASPEDTASPSPSPDIGAAASPSPSPTVEPTPSPSPSAVTPPDISNEETTAPPPDTSATPDTEYVPPVSVPPRGSSGVFQNGLGESVDYTWGYPLPESAAVEDTWFSDAAFIGNSLCDGLMLYGGLKSTTFFGAKSITVMNIYTEKSINSGSGYISITDALARKQYGKVFITLGINEIYLSSTQYYNKYSALIDYIRGIEPNAEIYLTAVSPVTKAKSDSGGSFTRENVLRFNEQIMKLSADKKCYYVDIYTALADENGYLPAEGSTDGVHLKRAYYEKWADYLRTHTITELGLEEVDVPVSPSPDVGEDPETSPEVSPENSPEVTPGETAKPSEEPGASPELSDSPAPDGGDTAKGEQDPDSKATDGSLTPSPKPSE